MNVQNYQFVITQVLVMHTFIHIWFLCASSGVLDLDNGQSGLFPILLWPTIAIACKFTTLTIILSIHLKNSKRIGVLAFF